MSTHENMFSSSNDYGMKEVIRSSVVSRVSVNNMKERHNILGKENAYLITFEEGNTFKHENKTTIAIDYFCCFN